MRFKWAEKMDLKKIEKVIKTEKPQVIAMVHHETSMGILNPIKQVGTLAKKYTMTFFVDAVSSAGAEKIDIEKWHISFVSTSSSKALSSFAGLSVVIGKKKAFEAIKDIPARTAYLNLYKFYKYATEKDQTPNTPAVPLFFALEQAVTNIIEAGGASKRHAHTRELARQLRRGLKAMGLKFLIDERDMSSVLTTVIAPKYMSVTELKKKLREKHIIIYDGKAEFAGKVFQVANIGEMTKSDIEFFLTELRKALGKHTLTGHPKKKTRKNITFIPEKNHFPFLPQVFTLNTLKLHSDK